MRCPRCQSERTTQLKRMTTLGYLIYRCRDCGKTFNERTGTPWHFVELPTDIIFQVVYFRHRYPRPGSRFRAE